MKNSQTSQDYILQCFATKLHDFAKFRMLFPAVLMDIPNFKVCLKGEWSIEKMAQLKKSKSLIVIIELTPLGC